MPVGKHKDCISEVIPNKLYMGPWEYAALDYKIVELLELGIKRIINVTDEISCKYPDLFEYLHIPVDDSDEEDIQKYFDEAIKFIDKDDSPVYVHCQMGRSRSATIVIAYIGKKNNWNYNQTYWYTSTCRTCILPNDGFQKQLIEYL